MYRLVFCDLDGTLATHEGVVRPAVQEAMRAVAQSGAYITLCTSRGYQKVTPFLPQIAVNAPLVCCNGALVVEAHTKRVYHLAPMPLALAQDLLRLAQEEGIEMHFFLDDMETMLENRGDVRRFVLSRDGAILRGVGDPVAALRRPPHKVFIMSSTTESLPEVMERVKLAVGDRARVLTTSPRGIDVILPGISKAEGMTCVARIVGVEQAQTLAVGDADNDVEMLAWAGMGIAMGNASPAAKAAADWIAPSVQEDGRAVVLRRYVLSA